MNLLAAKRSEIATALAVILPNGRFHAYPRPAPWTVAPCGWIEQPTGAEVSTSGGATKIVATFPIWFVYDGADEAQVAGLDDIVTQAWPALMAVPQVHPRRWRPDVVRVTSPDLLTSAPITWRAAVIDVDATVLAAAFCMPTPAASVIPPERVQL